MKKLFCVLSITLLTSCGIAGLLNEAEIKVESGKYSDAIELYTRAIKQDSNSVDAYEGRARIYEDLNIHDDAASDYIHAGTNAEFHLNDKKRAGRLYYSGALHMDANLLRSGFSDHCTYTKRFYNDACNFGHAIACDSKCLKE